MKKLYLHVGMPKCGSSAIQSTLSNRFFYENNTSVLYISIEPNGNVIYGENLVQLAEKSPFQYSSSGGIDALLKLSKKNKEDIAKTISLLFEKYDTLVMSNEGWGTRPKSVNDFFHSIFLTKKQFSIEVIAYVRPQVDWFNSAWWQWGAWSDHDIDFWIDKNLEHPNWLRHIEEWDSFEWVDDINIHLLNSNLLKDFFHIIKCNYKETHVSNKSSSSILLRFFQKNREFRQHSHHSAIEFVLARALTFPTKTTPWVIDKQNIDRLIDFYLPLNIQLRSKLDENTKKIFDKDLKWISGKPYQDKITELSSPLELSRDDYSTLLETCKKYFDSKEQTSTLNIRDINESNKIEILNEKVVSCFKDILAIEDKLRIQ